jgi:hypothetical protein
MMAQIGVAAITLAAMGGAHRATAMGFVSAFSRLPVHPANTKANNRAMILIRAIHSVRFPNRGDAVKGMLSSELAAGNMIRARRRSLSNAYV